MSPTLTEMMIGQHELLTPDQETDVKKYYDQIGKIQRRVIEEGQQERDDFERRLNELFWVDHPERQRVMQEWGMLSDDADKAVDRYWHGNDHLGLPDNCERRDGLILSLPIKARLVRRSEKRREQMYRILWALEEDKERTPWIKKKEEEKVRYVDPMHKEGGPVAWKYLPARCKAMLLRRQINLAEARACAQFVYLYQQGWLLYAPGTNFPRGEKLSGGGNKTHNHYAGKAFPTHLIEKPIMDILVAGLVADAPFKSLPGVKPGKSITMHRQGKRFFLGAIKVFDRVLTR